MIWALVTRLNDVLAVIGLGTVLYGVVMLTRRVSRLRKN
jgi:hypothetical protein